MIPGQGATFGRFQMALVPAGLFLSAVALLVVLERRRRRTGYYRYVWAARRRSWLESIWALGWLALCLRLSLRYPVWLAVLNYAAVAVAELAILKQSTEAYYRIMTAAHRFYRHYSWQCMSFEYFQAGFSILAIVTAQIVLMSSLVYLTPMGWQGVAAVGGMTMGFLVLVCGLFWLSNRRLYRGAMDRLRKERPEWLEAGASSAGGSGGPVDRDGA